MSYKIAEVKFNGGKGTVLCNVCRTMLTQACDTRHQIDCAHLCQDCYNELNAENYSKLYDFVRYIAHDYIELSHEKVRWQRDEYIKQARKLLNELENTQTEKVCCEGGEMSAGCFHDNCTGPSEGERNE